MVNVKIHNDGKQKWQSYEAWVEEIDCERGYGETEKAAIENYKIELKKRFTMLAKVINSIETDSFEPIEVGWDGKEI